MAERQGGKSRFFRSLGVSVASLLLLGLSGCLLHNVSPSERFRDAVEAVNSGARWSRVDIAIEGVHPEYRAGYMRRHREWGRVIQIADSEVVRLRVGDGGQEATSVITVSWYRLDTMTLASSTVRQQWELVGGSFMLKDERVSEGDADLLAEPPEGESSEGAAGLEVQSTTHRLAVSQGADR